MLSGLGLLCVVVVVVMATVVTLIETRIDSTLVKTYSQANNYKTRIYSDGRDSATVMFDDQDRIVDCHYQKGNITLVASIFHDAIVTQTSHQMIQFTDVRVVGRACNRFIRKVLRWKTGDEDPGNFKEAKLRQRLYKGISGTSWCSIHGYQSWRANEIDDRSTDRCCKILHSCNDTIEGLKYKDQYYNMYPWALHHCNCTEAFHSCLTASKGPAARETGNLYFNVLKLRCYDYEARDLCAEWDVWFTKCAVYNKTNFAVLKENASF